MCDELFQNPEVEIDRINSGKIRLNGSKHNILRLYPYQEEFIRSIYKNRCNIVYKARCMGYTTVYFVHAVTLLEKCHSECSKEDYEKCNFLIVSPNEMMSNCNKKLVKELIGQIGDKEFSDTAMDHFKFLSAHKLSYGLLGYGRHITEAFFDEFEFLKEGTDFIALGTLDVEKAIGVTSKTSEKHEPVVKNVMDFVERVGKGDVNVIMSPWYAHPEFSKNLMWYRKGQVLKEPTIDSDGYIAYRPLRWLTMILDGWTPFNEWRNERMRNGVKEEELLNFIFFPYERDEQTIPKFNSWS